MPRLMSVALTAPQVRARSKTVTRRAGWRFLRPGDHLTLCPKVMGFRLGEHPERIVDVEILSVSRERLDAITPADVAAEGFPEMTGAAEFVRFFCDHHKGCRPDSEVTRIEWRYLDGPATPPAWPARAAGPLAGVRPPADDGTRPVPGSGPARAVFVDAETAGAWGNFLRAAAPHDDADRGTRARPGSRAAARLRSAAVFGNRFFADVAIAVDRLSGTGDAGVTVRMVAADTGLADSAVRPVMRRLHDGGLLAEGTRNGRRALLYQVRRTPLWAGVLSACTALA